MATYIVTLVTGEELNAEPAPGPDRIMRAVAEAIYGEDISSHCRYAEHNPFTGDDVAHHARLGITVRLVP